MLEHVRGDERACVVVVVMSRLTEAINVRDQAVELCLAEHKVDEVTDRAEQRSYLLRGNGDVRCTRLSRRGCSIAELVGPAHLFNDITGNVALVDYPIQVVLHFVVEFFVCIH